MVDELWEKKIDCHHAEDDEEDGEVDDVEAGPEEGGDSFRDAAELPW